nr:hypothetical protein HK105_003603 [Polyrhizophydium stewartii]
MPHMMKPSSASAKSVLERAKSVLRASSARTPPRQAAGSGAPVAAASAPLRGNKSAQLLLDEDDDDDDDDLDLAEIELEFGPRGAGGGAPAEAESDDEDEAELREYLRSLEAKRAEPSRQPPSKASTTPARASSSAAASSTPAAASKWTKSPAPTSIAPSASAGAAASSASSYLKKAAPKPDPPVVKAAAPAVPAVPSVSSRSSAAMQAARVGDLESDPDSVEFEKDEDDDSIKLNIHFKNSDRRLSLVESRSLRSSATSSPAAPAALVVAPVPTSVAHPGQSTATRASRASLMPPEVSESSESIGSDFEEFMSRGRPVSQAPAVPAAVKPLAPAAAMQDSPQLRARPTQQNVPAIVLAPPDTDRAQAASDLPAAKQPNPEPQAAPLPSSSASPFVPQAMPPVVSPPRIVAIAPSAIAQEASIDGISESISESIANDASGSESIASQHSSVSSISAQAPLPLSSNLSLPATSAIDNAQFINPNTALLELARTSAVHPHTQEKEQQQQQQPQAPTAPVPQLPASEQQPSLPHSTPAWQDPATMQYQQQLFQQQQQLFQQQQHQQMFAAWCPPYMLPWAMRTHPAFAPAFASPGPPQTQTDIRLGIAAKDQATLYSSLAIVDSFVTSHLRMLEDFVRMNIQMADSQTYRRMHYTTLASVRESIEKRRPPAMTMDEALRRVREEAGEVSVGNQAPPQAVSPATAAVGGV